MQVILKESGLKVLSQCNIKDNNPCSEVEIWLGRMEILPGRVTQMALYYTVTSKRNPHVQPHSAIYSGYSACVAMMQYEMDDVTLDTIRGIDAIRRWVCALSRGICKSKHVHVLDAKNRNSLRRDTLRLSHIRDVYTSPTYVYLLVAAAAASVNGTRTAAHGRVLLWLYLQQPLYSSKDIAYRINMLTNLCFIVNNYLPYKARDNIGTIFRT